MLSLPLYHWLKYNGKIVRHKINKTKLWQTGCVHRCAWVYDQIYIRYRGQIWKKLYVFVKKRGQIKACYWKTTRREAIQISINCFNTLGRCKKIPVFPTMIVTLLSWNHINLTSPSLSNKSYHTTCSKCIKIHLPPSPFPT